MASVTLDVSLAYHSWANLRVLDAVAALTPSELDVVVEGTYGSILETLRHLVGSDFFYLQVLAPDPAIDFDEHNASLHQLREGVVRNERRWRRFVAHLVDESLVLNEREADGYERDASVAFRLAQALHHGHDHRSQLCTMLSRGGRTPPDIDVWTYGVSVGEIREIYATS